MEPGIFKKIRFKRDYSSTVSVTIVHRLFHLSSQFSKIAGIERSILYRKKNCI